MIQAPQHHQLCHHHGVPTLPKPRGSLSLLFSPNTVWSSLPSLPKLRGPLSGMAAPPGFKSQHQSSSAAPFLTPPTIGHSCQRSSIFPALLGCHSKSGQVWPHGMEPIFSRLSRRLCSQGSCFPVTSWVEVTPIPLAQSVATAI